MADPVMGSVTNAGWSVTQIETLLDMPFSDLLHRAQLLHRFQHPLRHRLR